MNEATDKFNKFLKAHGYSQSRARQDIFKELLNSKPVSMSDLTASLYGKLDRASIYRNINLFEKLGIVHRLNQGWKYKIELSEIFTSHHHHLTCLNCARVINVKEPDLEELINGVAKKNSFQPVNHQVEITGYCQKCAGLREPSRQK